MALSETFTFNPLLNAEQHDQLTAAVDALGPEPSNWLEGAEFISLGRMQNNGPLRAFWKLQDGRQVSTNVEGNDPLFPSGPDWIAVGKAVNKVFAWDISEEVATGGSSGFV